MSNAWSRPVSDAEAARRAGGRRRYNAWRGLVAQMRRHSVAEHLLAGRRQCEIARLLGVSAATISRDRSWLRKAPSIEGRCPVCGGRVTGTPVVIPGGNAFDSKGEVSDDGQSN